MSYTPEVENAATQWLAKHRATDDPRTIALIVQRAQELCAELGGYFSVAFCERAYLELCSEKKIFPFKGSMEAKLEAESAAVPQDVRDYIERTSAWELQRRYKTDATFRAQYDLHEKSKTSEQQAQPSCSTLSVQDYQKLSAREVARRYSTDRVFRAQVDSLISRGLIALLLLFPIVRIYAS